MPGMREFAAMPLKSRNIRREPPVTKPFPRAASLPIEIETGDDTEPVFSGLAAQSKTSTAAYARMHGSRKPEPQPEPLPEPEPEPEPEPVPAAQPQPQQAASPVAARLITRIDCDNLWDWVRQDSDRGHAFLGFRAESSVDVHAFMRKLLEHEQLGHALVRAIDLNDVHVGFAVLLPIIEQKKCALVHFYLNQQTRGFLPQLLPHLLHHANATRPDLRLVIMSDRPEWARLLAPHGFRQQIVLIRD